MENEKKKKGGRSEDKHQQGKSDFAELCACTYVEEYEHCNRCRN